MSDEAQMGLVVQADTRAAQAALTQLGDVLRDNATAAEAAGKGQKGLGLEVTKTKTLLNEQREATAKAKSATEEHALVVKVFGEKSKQAAASAEALTKAQKAEAEAASKAAKALEQTTKAVTEAAKAEGELSPATIRLAKQLEEMGKQAERAATDMRKADLQSKAGSKSFDLMGAASGKLMGVLGPAALGGSLVALAGWLGEASEKTLAYETTLANLPFTLDKAKEATHGLVSESQLAASASSAMSLGVVKSEAEFAKFADSATKLALKNGVSTGQMLADLTTAVGRGSVEILDNASIMVNAVEANEAYAASVHKSVEELTDAEKKGALQAAMMQAITVAAAGTKVEFDSNAAALVRLKTTANDAWEATQRGVTNGFGWLVKQSTAGTDALMATYEAQLKMQEAADLMNREMMRSQGWSQGFKDLATSAAESAVEMLGAQDTLKGFSILFDQGKVLLEQEEEKKNILSEEAKHAERIQKAYAKAAADNEAFLQAQAEHQIVYGPELPPKEEKKKKAVKKVDKDLELVKKTDFRHDESDLVNEMFAKDLAAQDKAVQDSYDLRSEIKEREIEMYDRELELFEARDKAEGKHYDLLFGTLDIENDVDMQRQKLLDNKWNRERDYARWQVTNARNDKQREEAATRLKIMEHKKQIDDIKKSQAAEQAAYEKKLGVVRKVTDGVTNMTNAMVEGAWAAAEGQKGALWMMVAEELKATSKRYTIKAAAEFASAAIAAAGVVTAGLAPGHLAAGGMALGVAALAGGASFAAKAIGEARGGTAEEKADKAQEEGWAKEEKDKKKKEAWQKENGLEPEGKGGKGGSGSGSGGSGGGGGGGSGRGGDGDEVDDDGIPTSSVERRNFDKRNAGMLKKSSLSGGTSITVNGTFLGGNQTQVAIALKRMMDDIKSSKPGAR